MATSLKLVTDAMATAIIGVAMTSPPPAPAPQTWQKRQGPEATGQESALEDASFDFDFPEARTVAPDFGIAVTQVIVQPVDVLLERERVGDVQDFDIVFNDDARAVADAVELYGAYPAGVDIVRFKSQHLEDAGSPNWVRARLRFEVRFQAKYSTAL